MERENIAYRLTSGRRLYVERGGKLGRKVGYRKPREDKEKQYAEVFRYIKKGYGVRTTSKITHVSESTIHRLKREFDMQAA